MTCIYSYSAEEHGIVVDFGKNLSTLRQTEWGPFFNVRTCFGTARELLIAVVRKPDAALGAAKPLGASLGAESLCSVMRMVSRGHASGIH